MDKKIIKLLDEAARARDPVERHQKLKATLEVDPECAACLFKLGISAYQRASEGGVSFDASIGYFESLRTKCPDFHSDVHYYLGAMYYAQGRSAESMKAFETFLAFPSDDPARMAKDVDEKTADVNDIMPEVRFKAEFEKNRTIAAPAVLRNVSTAADEYLPMLSPDNELLFFTRLSKYQAKGDLVAKDIEDLTEARRKDVNMDFDKGRALPEPFNVGDNYGGVTISVNNKEMFVTVCGPPDARGYKNCDIINAASSKCAPERVAQWRLQYPDNN